MLPKSTSDFPNALHPTGHILPIHQRTSLTQQVRVTSPTHYIPLATYFPFTYHVTGKELPYTSPATDTTTRNMYSTGPQDTCGHQTQLTNLDVTNVLASLILCIVYTAMHKHITWIGCIYLLPRCYYCGHTYLALPSQPNTYWIQTNLLHLLPRCYYRGHHTPCLIGMDTELGTSLPRSH